MTVCQIQSGVTGFVVIVTTDYGTPAAADTRSYFTTLNQALQLIQSLMTP